MKLSKTSYLLGLILAVASFTPRPALGALVYFQPIFPFNDAMWNVAVANQSLATTTDPLSLDPENSDGSGTINSSEDFWSSSTISLSHAVLNAFPSDYAQVVGGSHVEISTHPSNVIAISTGFGNNATSFVALGFNFQKTSAYAVNVYVKKASSSSAIVAPGLGPDSSGFWGFVADDPNDYVETVYFVQSNWPGSETPEFRISNIRVAPIPEPSALLLAALALPLALRRERRR